MPTKKTPTPKQNQRLTKQAMHQTILFGYILFFATTVLALLPAIFLWKAYVNPNANHGAVTMLLVSLVASAVVPPLFGYLVGSKATRGATKQLHHYNGVLFGLVGYWLALAFTMTDIFYSLVSQLPSYAQAFMWAPILPTLLILMIIGALYAHKTKHQTPLVHFKPFQATWFGAIALFFGAMVWSYVFNPYDYVDVNFGGLVALALPVVVMGLFIAIGYWRTKRTTALKVDRIIKSLIAVTFGLIAISVASQILNYIPVIHITVNTFFYSLAVGVVTWVAYMVSSPDFK